MNINQVWPEWHEDCLLGEGSFGKVYRAKRVEYGRTFYSAIKVLTVPKSQQEVKFARAQGMNDAEVYNYFHSLIENLLNEITLMENLKGAQNIVGIEDYKIIEREGEIGWDIFIRMELLTPFDNFVSNPEFSQKDVLKLGVDICTALETCEQNFIVHRDIKPDNIFISRFGEYKLGDFGIARKLETSQANLSRKGTLNYMAPEVYKSEEYGSNVDIYSLGLVLYTLLNNNRIAFLPPYPQPITYRDNEEALSMRLSGTALTPPCNASPSLGAVILKACAYNPQERFQSATEFKNALINEWNYLVQTGENQEIGSNAMKFNSNLVDRLQSTTNDMTANGRLVVDEFSQDTTMRNQSSDYEQSGENTLYAPFYEDETRGNSGFENLTFTQTDFKAKSSKPCRLLAIPLAITLIIIAFTNSFYMFFMFAGTGISMLLCDRNRRAVGINIASLSACIVIEQITDTAYLFDNPAKFILLISSVLLIVSGLAIIFHKEARFGGAMCIYSVVAFIIYMVIAKVDFLSSGSIWYIVFCLAVFLWSYGYDSREVIKGNKKISYIASYVLAGLVTLQNTIYILYILG